MPWKVVEQDDRYCVAKEDADGSAGEIVPGGCHETKEQALDHMRALYANVEAQEETPPQNDEVSETPVTLIALADYASYRPVQFLRTGTFTDANGNKVTITDDDLDKIVANFASGAAGQDVPIDIQHERREAAGWVQSVTKEEDRLIAQVNWTEFGKTLVADKVYKYLSATIDKARWVLKSISLVNFPAVKGLPAIEFAEYAGYVHDAVPPSQLEPGHEQAADVATQPEASMTEEIKPEGTVETPTPQAAPAAPLSPVVLSENDVAQLRANIEREMKDALMAEYTRLEQSKATMFAELMAQVREEREIVEFAEKVTSSGSHALPIRADDLKAFLTDLPKPMRARAIILLRNIFDAGTVDFTEHGTTGGKAVKQLDPDVALALRGHLKSGGSVDIFFAANDELGPKTDYDLAEFGGNNG